VGIASNNVEYFDEPALAVMLCELPSDQYRVFSGVAPLNIGFEAHTALVHADGNTPELPELIEELAQRTDSGYLFGGLAASRSEAVQFAMGGDGFMRGQGKSTGVFHGGLSGVAFGPDVRLVSRVTQGCLPINKARRVTQSERNLVIELDGQPALDVLLKDLNVSLEEPAQALQAVRATLVGLMRQAQASAAVNDSSPVGRTGNFGPDVIVRHIIGLDPTRRGLAVADLVAPGMQLAFCQRNAKAARADLMRICAEIREELEPEELPVATVQALGVSELEAAPHPARRIAGAVYVSCSGRGGPHFGGASAELQIVRHALGDVPLVGFFAGGEIARNHVYGYTGVLTVFTGD
jgi:small ligand-binding sensory domain FIST